MSTWKTGRRSDVLSVIPIRSPRGLGQGGACVRYAERGNKSAQEVNKIQPVWTSLLLQAPPPPSLSLPFGCGLQRATKQMARALNQGPRQPKYKGFAVNYHS